MKKKIVNKIVEGQVANALLDNPDYTAPELKKIVEKMLKEKGYNYRFTERTYLNIKKMLLPALGPRPEDKPWSAGCCIKEDISLNVVMPYQHLLLTSGRFLTIRRARWYSKLYPELFPLLEKAYPQQPSRNQRQLHQIASFYTRMEQIAEISGEVYPDTRDLDNTFFFRQDFSFKTMRRMWCGLYRQVPEKLPKVTDGNASKLKAEQILGEKMTEDEAKLVSKIIKLLRSEKVSDWEKADALVEENPDIQPLVEEWMVLGLRRDIKISKEEGEK